MWKTTDGGTTGHSLTDDLPNLAVVIPAMEASNRDEMYMGTGEGFGGSAAIAAVAGYWNFKATGWDRT